MTDVAERAGSGVGTDRADPPHALVTVLPLLHDTLIAVSLEAMLVVIVTDARGHVLWRRPRFAEAHHSWTRAASPVHDPETGAVLGAVDVIGPDRTFHPTTRALVAATARLTESHLTVQRTLVHRTSEA